MIASGDLQGALVLSAAFAFVVGAAEAWRRLGHPEAEWTRKFVHLAGGIVCLLFPFMIRSPWVVLAMALGLTGVFALAARTGALRSLHAIKRPSRGVEYYPLAVWLVFLLTVDRPWLYVSAVLVLAVGDAFAALVGSRYGVIRYEVEEDHKSLEGSLVFLVITFLAIHLPMLLMTDLPRATSVLAALLVAILVTGFEAISLQGADNLFVPLAVVLLLGKITTQPVPEIVSQNLSLAAIILGVALMAWRFPLFNVGGTIVVILYAYGGWSLGSWHWALPVFCGFVCFVGFRFRASPPRRSSPIRVRVVARALVAPFLFLAIANGTLRYGEMFGPYVAASAAVLAFGLIAPPADTGNRRAAGIAARALGLASIATAVIAVPAWLVRADTPGGSLLAVAAAVFPITLALGFHEARVGRDAVPQWSASRFVLSLAAGAIVLLLQASGVTPAWSPF